MKLRKVNRGLVHVYTGNGKGKTTAALGLAMRMISYKKKVLIVQFIKGPWRSGELDIVKKLKPYLKITALGEGFIKILGDRKSFEVHKQAALQALEYVNREMKSGKYNLIILDEINVAIREKLIPITMVLTLIKQKPAKLELVLTGRNAPDKIIKQADYVSEIKEVKHPYQKGILARDSVDY
ncbi:MAG: cob(I)yrinic acid a,c-diamide adenosyltransferase [Candidatus Kerfeldbacteria bacterium]|jgi:cob(I)alamin adenosyltransferase